MLRLTLGDARFVSQHLSRDRVAASLVATPLRDSGVLRGYRRVAGLRLHTDPCPEDGPAWTCSGITNAKLTTSNPVCIQRQGLG